MPQKLKDDGKTPVRLDHWWAAVFRKHDFFSLEKVVKAALSIVTGPRIEQSFTGMNSTITSTTNRLNTSTFSALQTVKMDLTASKETSFKRYHRKNFLNLLSILGCVEVFKLPVKYEFNVKTLTAKELLLDVKS